MMEESDCIRLIDKTLSRYQLINMIFYDRHSLLQC